jgi:hypothetical protein
MAFAASITTFISRTPSLFPCLADQKTVLGQLSAAFGLTEDIPEGHSANSFKSVMFPHDGAHLIINIFSSLYF